MNSLPAAVKANTIKLANNDVKLYNDWIRAPIKRNHRLKKPLKPIPPTAFPTVSEHIKQLTCFEMPMSNDRPMRSRHFFIRMRLRGIIDIEEELLNSIVQHLNDLQDLKDDNRTSGFTIAMMEGDLLRQLGVIRGARWIKLKVICELAIIQQEVDHWSSEQPDD
ncbi:uncharacterized protein LAJ45_03681 [Morchella importuna]|uniref:uncharacterized protein n=1 Tax=Morchella importuna TaxID=1174673 RepID=UPI001E8DC3A1|nr:uncharacterized protein LAJ45_03681 [Morchella importuna]KAH8152255.1 hypothetical protein LAJ45_03681 [Morchella importuna]